MSATAWSASAPFAAPAAVHGALWRAVDDIVDRAPTPADVHAHRLHLFANARWRATGRPVPAEFVDAARGAALASLAVPLLLARIRAVCDGPLIVLKGPEAGAPYPRRTPRPYGDLDLLVRDPVATQRALIDAGFTEVGDERIYRGIHHLRPLHYATFPLVIEVHGAPKWIEGIEPPSFEELLAATVPARIGVDGILALAPPQHALVLAAHSWAHTPLDQLLQLVDIAAARAGVPDQELEELARRWGLERVWRVTDATIAAVLFGSGRPLPLRLWARGLPRARARTVVEHHLERVLSPFSAFPPRRALALSCAALRRDLRPLDGEGWAAKTRRARRALRNAFVRRLHHDAEVGRER